MGFFDIFQKKNKRNKPEEGKGEAPDNGVAKAAGEDTRSFTLLVEDTFQLKGNLGVVAGTVRGTICREDPVYIIQPGNQVTLASVKGLETKIGHEMKELNTATDIPVSVFISAVQDKSQVPRFSLLTSIRPQTAPDVNTAVENPYVLGMCREYPRFQGDGEYQKIFISQIIRAHYLVPMFLDREPEAGGSGKAVFTQDTTMSFPSLPHPQDPKKQVFPVFTDWREVDKWTGLFSKDSPGKTMIFSFHDCSALATKDHSGMVINPYGSTPVFLPHTMVESILKSQDYKNEFPEEKEPPIQKVKVERNTRIMLGVPKDVNEVRLVREALWACGKRNPDVDAIYLLLKVDENNKRAYFCVTDSAGELPGEVYAQMYREAKPFAQEVQLFEFVGRRDIPELEDSLTGEALIYKKA